MAGDTYKKQLAKLWPGIFQEGWLSYLREFEIPPNHPTWTAPAPLILIPTSPATYLLILLLDFNEEEYATLSTEGDDVNATVAQGNELAGVSGVVVEGADDNEDKGDNLFEG